MVERNTLDTVRGRVGPLVTATGLAMVAIAYLGYSAEDHPQAAAPPRPSVTVTATAKPSKHAHPAGSLPAPNPRQTSDGGVVAASAPKAGTGRGPTSRPSAPTPSGPAPSPPAASQPAAAFCTIGVTVLVLNACLNLGGNR